MEFINRKLIAAMVAVTITVCGSSVFAHHSFAVHFEAEGEVRVSGVIKSFRFANPHGVIELTVMNENNEEEVWRAETNSPSLLRRRGWSRDSLQAGDEVTLIGWPARKDKQYMRIRSVTFADGSILATQGGAAVEQD